MKLLTDLEAVEDVFQALYQHKDGSRDLVEAACSTLWALSVNGERVIMIHTTTTTTTIIITTTITKRVECLGLEGGLQRRGGGFL